MNITTLCKRLLFSSLIISMPAIYAGDVSLLHAVVRDGSTKILFHRAVGVEVEVVVDQININKSYPYKQSLLWGGDIQSMPSSILSMIKVIDGDKVIFIPLSAYCDLGDVKYLSLTPIKNGFNVNIYGGETATSYDAILKFKGGYLVNRVVRLREFPDQRYEETVYKWPPEY